MRALALVLLAGCASEPPEVALSMEDADVAEPLESDASVEDAVVDAGLDPAPPDAAPMDLADASPDAMEARCAPRAAGDRVLSIESGGQTRTALIHVPASLDDAPAMVVLNFHGVTEQGQVQADHSQMIAASDAYGFIAVHPNGLNASWNAGDCCAPPGSPPDDVAFVRDLLDALEDECIDADRVFATGMSNGALFSYRLGCELADRIAAIEPVSGVLPIPEASCTPSRPVPVLHFHGNADPVVPYDGGYAFGVPFGTPFRSVRASVEHFRTKNGCDEATTVTLTSGASRCEAYACDPSATVELCTLDGGDHNWPGPAAAIEATPRIIEFFLAHPR